MRYYKFLEIDWINVAKSMKEYVITNPALYAANRGAWVNCDFTDLTKNVPKFQEMFTPLGLTVKRVSLFIMRYNTGVIHIDDDRLHPYRINFPILNCSNTETRYFKAKSEPTMATQPNNVAYHIINPSTCELVDSFELDRPVIIKTQEPHQVIVHHKNFPRVSCTVAFYEDLEPLFNKIDSD